MCLGVPWGASGCLGVPWGALGVYRVNQAYPTDPASRAYQDRAYRTLSGLLGLSGISGRLAQFGLSGLSGLLGLSGRLGLSGPIGPIGPVRPTGLILPIGHQSNHAYPADQSSIGRIPIKPNGPIGPQ